MRDVTEPGLTKQAGCHSLPHAASPVWFDGLDEIVSEESSESRHGVLWLERALLERGAWEQPSRSFLHVPSAFPPERHLRFIPSSFSFCSAAAVCTSPLKCKMQPLSVRWRQKELMFLLLFGGQKHHSTDSASQGGENLDFYIHNKSQILKYVASRSFCQILASTESKCPIK